MNKNQDSTNNNNVGTAEAVTLTHVKEEEKPKRKRYSRSFGQNLQRGSNMVAGIAEHLETLKEWGLNEEKAAKLKKLVEDCTNSDNEQKQLKGQLKTKTEEVNKCYEEFKALYSEYSGIIKSIINQKNWVKFGISAKQ